MSEFSPAFREWMANLSPEDEALIDAGPAGMDEE